MPEPNVFHPRTAPLCRSHRWKDWGGYYAVCSYDTSHEPEYFALRHSAGLLDVSPLFKYEIRGPGHASGPGGPTGVSWASTDRGVPARASRRRQPHTETQG